jgi:CubicO group peptidase (beta-lactamase class C family)
MRKFAFAVCLAGALGICSPSMAIAAPPPANPAADLDHLLDGAMTQYKLKAIIVQVAIKNRTVYAQARGDSMAGVKATPAMNFRNGAFAFTYMATLLLELSDWNVLSLDDKLAKYLPDLPQADKVTLRQLANMTAGYADYVYQPEVLQGITRDPFRQWTSDELIRIGTSKPMQFAPGTNWGYSHTNYVILGRVLEKATRMKLADALQQFVVQPMGLTNTHSFDTPFIPEPVLHSFSAERRPDLGIPAATPFDEESTYWNPSWTTATGAVQTTDIADLVRTMIVVGTGKLLSKASSRAQIGPNLIGTGHPDPTCAACRANTKDFSYGMGVLNIGPWLVQTKSFAGSGAAAGYLASHRLAIAVVTTYAADAYDDKGNVPDASAPILAAITRLLAPDAPIAIPK